jgi:hypothetical protein
MRAAQERKRPVVNARKARIQNFSSSFIDRYFGQNEERAQQEPVGVGIRRRSEGRRDTRWAGVLYSELERLVPPASDRPCFNQCSIAPKRMLSSTIGFVM